MQLLYQAEPILQLSSFCYGNSLPYGWLAGYFPTFTQQVPCRVLRYDIHQHSTLALLMEFGTRDTNGSQGTRTKFTYDVQYIGP